MEGFLVLGFPASLERSDFARALLFGADGLLDVNAIVELYAQRQLSEAELDARFEQAHLSGTWERGLWSQSGLSNRIENVILLVLNERINALETWLSNRLAQVAQERRGESLRLVTSTLDRIEAFRAAKSAAVPSPVLYSVPRLVRQGPTSKLFTLHGEPNVPYQLQTSANLRDWSPLPTPLYRDGEFFDTVPLSGARFYRATVQP